MFRRKKTHNSIVIEFYEKGAPSPFYTAMQPLAHMPDTFEINTTLSIGGEAWEIWEAVPPTKAEFRQTGRLKLSVYKPVIKSVGSEDIILFSLPTINDEIAALEDRDSLENVLVVHEDDWRQQELISGVHAESIETELAAIRNIYETERQDAGFRNLHIRSLIPTPLDGVHLPLHELKAKMGVSHLYSGLAFSHMHAVIQRGFAFRASNGLILWGQLRENDELAFGCLRFPKDLGIGVEAFDALMAANNLVFVDWVQTVAGRRLSDVLLKRRS